MSIPMPAIVPGQGQSAGECGGVPAGERLGPGQVGLVRNGDRDNPANVGSQRLFAAAATGDRHDRALWTATAKASGAAGNSTALAGTPETVAQALPDYHELGVTTFLIRGYDPLDDAIDHGRELIPAVPAEVTRRDAQRLAIAA
ncbi:LLM class flavin-dependent oxidoreductase [Actinoplanes sp. NPDC049316]|uniref:LLM class flavin-dependent oxidoreductase n=1 Tax=Actinoplanes sp. NPDC049316 TaxID=3154727 RepID=UPI003436EA7A